MQDALKIALAVFTVAELMILRVFIIKKAKAAVRSTVTSLILLWLAVIVTLVFDFQMPDMAFFIMIFFLLIDSGLGYYWNLYNRSRTFDRLAHGMGSFTFAIFFYFFLSNLLEYGGSRAFHAAYVLLLGISFGAVFEIVEFITDAKQSIDQKQDGEKMQRGLRDTNFDLLSDIIGSVGASVIAYFIMV